jgi:hypothetical protein
VQWHISNNNDPAIRWVVERIAMIAGENPIMATSSNVVTLKERGMSHDEIAEQYRTATTPHGRS